MAGGVVVLLLLALVGLLIAGVGVADFVRKRPCPLPALNFDVETSRTLSVGYLPPNVRCEWRMSSGRTAIQENDYLFPLVMAPLGAFAACGAAVFWSRRRGPANRAEAGLTS